VIAFLLDVDGVVVVVKGVAFWRLVVCVRFVSTDVGYDHVGEVVCDVMGLVDEWASLGVLGWWRVAKSSGEGARCVRGLRQRGVREFVYGVQMGGGEEA
jgi:hypothetical protein